MAAIKSAKTSGQSTREKLRKVERHCARPMTIFDAIFDLEDRRWDRRASIFGVEDRRSNIGGFFDLPDSKIED